jgi:hypothetical protein
LLAIRYLVIWQQRFVSTVRQRLMSTAVTFSALGCVLVGGHRDLRSLGITGLPGDGYGGHAL